MLMNMLMYRSFVIYVEGTQSLSSPQSLHHLQRLDEYILLDVLCRSPQRRSAHCFFWVSLRISYFSSCRRRPLQIIRPGVPGCLRRTWSKPASAQMCSPSQACNFPVDVSSPCQPEQRDVALELASCVNSNLSTSSSSPIVPARGSTNCH